VLNIFSEFKESTAVITKRKEPGGAAVRSKFLEAYKSIKSHNSYKSNKYVELEMLNIRN
jgi:AICAR transformylase/IMP cyclohydrolase PurH